MLHSYSSIQVEYRVRKCCFKMSAAKKLVSSPSRPPTREKFQSCTHQQLTRLFDEFGCDKCSICHRRPQLGWLYRCTQDFDNFLPASDFCDVEDNKRFDHDAQLYTLSPSVTKAAAEGNYTDNELNMLWKQKIEVRRTIRQVIPDPSSSAASTTSSSQHSLPASITTSTIRTSESDPDTELSQLTDYIPPSRGPLQPIQEVHDDLEDDHRILPFAKTTSPPPCNFKVCQACRPIYQQRAWQSINAVLNAAYKPPPTHEMANRRVSDVNIVKRIGMRTSSATAHDRGLLDSESKQGKRHSRTQFQDIIQQLLREQERSSVDTEAVDEAHCGYALKCVPARQNLFESATKDSSSDDGMSDKTSQASSTLLRPLYHRRGSERLASIQPASRKVESRHGEGGSAAGLTSQSNNSCPAVVELRIDTTKANEDREHVPQPQKTPTESIKESLYRFSGIKKPSTRFTID